MAGSRGRGSGTAVHLVDGTYELFRHFFGQPPHASSDGTEVGAARGVVQTVLTLLADGATHIGVATDHVIESFRNEMWADYKTGEGVDPLLLAQFNLLEEALGALGVLVWAMVEVEADDALASGAAVAAGDDAVSRVFICTPDKDLAQCVDGTRVVQLDRRRDTVIDEAGVLEKFGVLPESIPDWLALVGDSADGFPGLQGWGKVSASTVLRHYRHLEDIPDSAQDWDPSVGKVRGAAGLAGRLAEQRELAMLFRELATLRVDRNLLPSIAELRWRGPAAGFPALCDYLRDPGMVRRAESLAEGR
ncbi:MAG: 5'-3' exonuclease [Acidimicrobiales bacterium]